MAEKSGINAKNISLLENNRLEIGKKRAEQLAKVFNVHPAPEYESAEVLKLHEIKCNIIVKRYG